MKKKPWIDNIGQYRCECCGRAVLRQKLYWERGLGYCKICYREILAENQKKAQSGS